jgi:hypothetical protein
MSIGEIPEVDLVRFVICSMTMDADCVFAFEEYALAGLLSRLSVPGICDVVTCMGTILAECGEGQGSSVWCQVADASKHGLLNMECNPIARLVLLRSAFAPDDTVLMAVMELLTIGFDDLPILDIVRSARIIPSMLDILPGNGPEIRWGRVSELIVAVEPIDRVGALKLLECMRASGADIEDIEMTLRAMLSEAGIDDDSEFIREAFPVHDA